MTFPLRETPPRALHPDDVRHEPSRVLLELPAAHFAGLTSQLRLLGIKDFRYRWLRTSTEAPLLIDLAAALALPHLLARIAALPVRVYLERQVGLWVEQGYTLSERLTPPDGEWYCCNTVCTYEIQADDFYVLPSEFVAPTTNLAPTVTTGIARWPVAVRLVPTLDHEPARLWIIRADALTQLGNYCRTANELLLQRFMVCVSTGPETPFVVLRANHTKGPPPIFVGSALAFRPYLRLSNLYVPVGMKLIPAIRRDTLRQLLGDRPNQLTWVDPRADGQFQVESLSEQSFRPLVEMLDYRVLACVPRRTWEPKHRLDMEPFREVADVPKTTIRSVPAPTTRVRGRVGLVTRAMAWLKNLRGARTPTALIPPTKRTPVTVPESGLPSLGQADRLHHARPETNSQAIERCQQLEIAFLRLLPTTTNDSPAERWIELAGAYETIGNDLDAAHCWLNALWDESTLRPATALGWLRSEAKAARLDLTTFDPEPWLQVPATLHTTRALAAWVVWATQQALIPPELPTLLKLLQTRLEAEEHWLPVRAAWLAHVALAQHVGQDILGLARTRDRLLERLHQAGLSVELDSPSFIRYAGDGMRERFHEARRWLADKHELVQQWLATLSSQNRFTTATTPVQGLYATGLEANIVSTQAYAGLIFGWGLMRFAHVVAAENLRKQAVEMLPPSPVHQILREAFEYRIGQLRDGKPARGPLPPPLLTRLQTLNYTERYIVNKLREHSRILEPNSQIDAYQAAGIDRRHHDRRAHFCKLNNDQFNSAITTGLQNLGAGSPLDLIFVACERAREVSPENVALLAPRLPVAIEHAMTAPPELVRLLEHGLTASVVWDRADYAQQFVDGLRHLVEGLAGWDLAERLTSQAVRCLRRFGLKREAEDLLNSIADAVLKGQSLAKMRQQRPHDWSQALLVLLDVAGGWYYAGQDEQAHAILDAARDELFQRHPNHPASADLAFAYANALAFAPVRIALGRLEELFQRLAHLPIRGTTNMCYALKPLMLVETAVRVVVSDDFTMGQEVRSWLDADEFVVRRRIHRDMKAILREQEFS